jgi:hypothetical protein
MPRSGAPVGENGRLTARDERMTDGDALPPARDPHILAEGHAATPFTADEIRAGCPEGRMIRLHVEEPGSDSLTRDIRFVRCDAHGADQEFRQYDAAGRPLGEPLVRRSTWLELQEHASYPAAAARIGAEALETPMGVLDCLRYTVADADHREILWFARSLPGMPVRTESYEGERLTYRMRMVENHLPRDRSGVSGG